jgi:beta-glucanase (GH16 family)
MRKAAIPLIAALAVAACSSQQYVPAPTVSPTSASPQPLQVLGQLNPTQLAHWLPAPWPHSSHSQLACFTPKDVSITQYVLMRIVPKPCAGRPWSGSWLQSPKRYLYGTFEARIYLPAAPNGTIANWPAFWLEDPNDWPVNGEIDVMEAWAGQDCQTIHYGPRYRVMLSVDTRTHCVLDTPGWHTFAINWNAARVKWYVDGRLTGVVRSHVPDHAMQVVLDYTAWKGKPDSLAPATMQVAWVRIYKEVQ